LSARLLHIFFISAVRLLAAHKGLTTALNRGTRIVLYRHFRKGHEGSTKLYVEEVNPLDPRVFVWYLPPDHEWLLIVLEMCFANGETSVPEYRRSATSGRAPTSLLA
jgi:hypothetical protein